MKFMERELFVVCGALVTPRVVLRLTAVVALFIFMVWSTGQWSPCDPQPYGFLAEVSPQPVDPQVLSQFEHYLTSQEALDQIKSALPGHAVTTAWTAENTFFMVMPSTNTDSRVYVNVMGLGYCERRKFRAWGERRPDERRNRQLESDLREPLQAILKRYQSGLGQPVASGPARSRREVRLRACQWGRWRVGDALLGCLALVDWFASMRQLRDP